MRRPPRDGAEAEARRVAEGWIGATPRSQAAVGSAYMYLEAGSASQYSSYYLTSPAAAGGSTMVSVAFSYHMYLLLPPPLLPPNTHGHSSH